MFIPYLCFRFWCTFIQYEITAYYQIDLHVQCVEVLLTYPDRKGSNFGVWQHKRLLTEKLPPAKTSSGIHYNIFNIIFPFLQIFVIIHIHGRKEVIKPRAFPTIQACTIPLKYSFVKKRIDICIKHRKRITQCFYILFTDWKVNYN